MVKPFLHTFLLVRIKKNTKSPIVSKGFLKDQIARVILRHAGMPKFMLKYVIQDMVNLGLIECLNNKDSYKLLDNPEEKAVKSLYFLD